MKRIKQLLICMLVAISVAASGQYTKEFRRIFLDAEYLYTAGFYGEAFNRYKNLLTLDPGNHNILFLCGACCLNTPGSEQLAVTYLSEAIPGVTPSYKDHSHKEPGAPVLTYFMLGRAYHLLNDFDRAIEYYNLYQDAGEDEDPVQLAYAAAQIEACKRASEIEVERPSYEFHGVLDQFDEDLPSCNNPVISGDGNILIFVVDYPADKKVMMTSKTDNVWSRPRIINNEIGMVGDTYPVSLSYDGKDLYFVHQFFSHSDIFVSNFENGQWSEARELGPNINGRTSENHGSISKDGKTLYFTSDARGGSGSFDIYVSQLDEKGEWGIPANLGPEINTPFEEHTPFISSNDSILFFSSQGHATVGGADVFYSVLGEDGLWGEPVNLGSPVNTSDDDLFFNPGWDNQDGYYAVRREDDPTTNVINIAIQLEPVEEIAEVVEEKAPVETTTPTLTQAIEPEEVDEIEEVLNRHVQKEEENPVEEAPAEETSAPEENYVEHVKGPLELHTGIPFEHNEFELNMAAMLEVERVADLMISNPGTRIYLSGHADATGSAEHNLLLSLQRSNQVASYLEMRGVGKDRIQVEAMGESAPLARNQYPDGEDAPLGRYLNRHVFVKVSGQTPLYAELAGLYVPESLKSSKNRDDDNPAQTYWFTIQVRTSDQPLAKSYFQSLEEIKEILCTDEMYRYTSGSFRTFQEARDHLKRIHKSGYEDAFLQTMDWYERHTN